MDLEAIIREDFNRLNDVFFKKLLGSPKRKNLTLDFLNSLKINNGKVFTDITFTDKDLDAEFVQHKQSKLDIRGILNDNTEIDIEVQVYLYPTMSDRSLYYWARLYSCQLSRSQHYSKLAPTVVVNVLGHNFLPEEKSHNVYKIMNVDSHNVLTDKLEMHFLELPKLNIKDLKHLTGLEAWAAYLANKLAPKDMEVLIMENTNIREAKIFEDEFLRDRSEQWAYLQREKAERDYYSFLAEAKAEGKDEVKTEIAKKLIAMGYPMKDIVTATGLDLATLQNLANA